MKTNPATKTAKIKNAKDLDVEIIVHKNSNSNEYLKVGNYWVRNFGGIYNKPWDVNNFHDDAEIQLIIDNEINNCKMRHPTIDPETIRGRDVLIVSDGYGFENHNLFNEARKDLCIITVNHAARFWNCPRFPNYLLVNNPTDGALSCLPTRTFPRLIASRRTYTKFIELYNNVIYFYDPVPQPSYSSPIFKDNQTLIDDYRNPVCAAISLAHKYQLGNIYLAFCSYGYKENKAGTVEIQDGLFQYPQQKIADQLIDGNLFWYKFSNKYTKIFHTGIENSYQFSRYLKTNEFIKALL